MRSSYLFILVSVFLQAFPGAYSQQSFSSLVFESYIHGDLLNWEKTLNDPKFQFTSPEDRYERAMALYGFIGLCMDQDEKKRAKAYVEQLTDLSDQLLNENPENPSYLALRAASYGMQMIFQKHLMMVLGPKSVKTLQKANEIDPNCPQVLVELGNQDWVMPSVFGGDKTRANRHYRRAITILQSDSFNMRENWYFVKIQMILADRYESLGFKNLAEPIYTQFLEEYPEFSLAKKRLAALSQ